MLTDTASNLAALAPIAEAMLRVFAGLALVPHALRNTFDWFAGTGQPLRSIGKLAQYFDEQGYRPGWLWAPATAAVQFIAGPLLALGLFTQAAAFPILCFLLVANVERWRVGRYFWNKLGLEYTLMWTLVVLYFIAHGGGQYSLDRLLFAG
jgi:putative oxidoreductase